MFDMYVKSLASWYSVFEKEGFEIEVELTPFLKKINGGSIPFGSDRILDNLFQNALRHAKSGQYIGVKTESTDQYDAFIITTEAKGWKMNQMKKEQALVCPLSI